MYRLHQAARLRDVRFRKITSTMLLSMLSPGNTDVDMTIIYSPKRGDEQEVDYIYYTHPVDPVPTLAQSTRCRSASSTKRCADSNTTSSSPTRRRRRIHVKPLTGEMHITFNTYDDSQGSEDSLSITGGLTNIPSRSVSEFGSSDSLPTYELRGEDGQSYYGTELHAFPGETNLTSGDVFDHRRGQAQTRIPEPNVYRWLGLDETRHDGIEGDGNATQSRQIDNKPASGDSNKLHKMAHLYESWSDDEESTDVDREASHSTQHNQYETIRIGKNIYGGPLRFIDNDINTCSTPLDSHDLSSTMHAASLLQLPTDYYEHAVFQDGQLVNNTEGTRSASAHSSTEANQSPLDDRSFQQLLQEAEHALEQSQMNLPTNQQQGDPEPATTDVSDVLLVFQLPSPRNGFIHH